MVTSTSKLGDCMILANSSSQLEPQAKWLLSLFEKMHRGGSVIGDGFKIKLGWSILTLRRQSDGVLVVHEPDFSRNPFKDELASVNTTLEIVAKQNAFAERFGLAPVAISFQDKILISRGVLDEASFYMERSAPSPENCDSGWYFGAKGVDMESPVLEAVYAYKILQTRPELVDALILPAGYIALVNQQKITSILNERNEPVLCLQ